MELTIILAMSYPPNKGQIGLKEASAGRKGQKRGLYSWFVTSKRAWEMFPSRQENTSVEDSL